MNSGALRSLLLRHSACVRISKTHAQRYISPRSTLGPQAYYRAQVIPPNPRQTSRAFATSTAKMTTLKAGDKFPEDVVFSYVPWSPETDSPTACGIPIDFKASKEFADKKVVLFAVPGAFTPGCSVRHLPGYIEHLEKIKGKGVDLVCVIASNDAFVMSAWAKVNGIKDEILFLSDTDIKFSKSIGFEHPSGQVRTARYAMVIDHGKILYAEKEPARDVTVSGALAVLESL